MNYTLKTISKQGIPEGEQQAIFATFYKGKTPEAGDTFGIYFASKGRIAHTGLVAGVKGNSIITIEANTSPQPAAGEADRNGDGVWKKIRPLSTIHSTKRWLP